MQGTTVLVTREQCQTFGDLVDELIVLIPLDRRYELQQSGDIKGLVEELEGIVAEYEIMYYPSRVYMSLRDGLTIAVTTRLQALRQ